MAEEQIKNSIRARRADIANYMDNYNQHYGITDRNNPDLIGIQSKSEISCRCEHGHDFSKKAINMVRITVDDHGVIYCPECHQQGIRVRPYISRQTWETSLFEYCKNNVEKKYLLDEWDYEKNELDSLTPTSVACGTNRSVWWRCSLGHSYEARISHRKNGLRCPYCIGRRVLAGFNDLESQYPEIAQDWDHEKNVLRPNQIVQHSSSVVHWKCHKCGHEWKTAVSKRTGKQPSGCPKCINHGMSRIEMAIYLTLKKQFPLAKYRNKINGVEFDIILPEIKLAIEYDGWYFHNPSMKRSRIDKASVAQTAGLTLFRVVEERAPNENFYFENNVLFYNVNYNTKYIEVCKQVLLCLTKHYNARITIDVDENIIKQAIAAIASLSSDNSLAVQAPQVAAEWHPTKNGVLKPENLDVHSHVDAWWICSKCNNEYKKTIHRRTDIRPHSAGGCPYCSGQRRLVGFNDFETLFPGISQFWCAEENEAINMKLEECAPRSIKYTYWDFGEGPQKMQIRNAVTRYKRWKKNNVNIS